VIRTCVEKLGSDEDGEARITCSVALADSVVGMPIFVMIFVDRFRAPSRGVVGSEFEFGGCSREDLRGDDFDYADDFEAVS